MSPQTTLPVSRVSLRQGMDAPHFCTYQDALQTALARPPSSFPSNLWPGCGPIDTSLQRLTATVITPFRGQLFILCIFPVPITSGPLSRTAGHLPVTPQLIGTEQEPESNRGDSGFSFNFQTSETRLQKMMLKPTRLVDIDPRLDS